LLGWTVGPFAVAIVVLGVLAALGWPRTPNLRYFMPGVPILVGIVCFTIHARPKGLQWLILLPYAIGYFVAVTGASIVMAILMGAPK
jgi:ABC-type polysaccharide/polyol phosphate export permease